MAQSAYTPLVEQSETITVTSSTSEPTFVELCMMRRAARWVTITAVIQALLGVFALLSGGFLFGVVSLIFVVFGFVGVSKRRPRLLTAHFAFSVALYILTLIAIITMIVYCNDCSFWAYLFLFVFLMFQAVGMKHSRILIGLLKMYPQYANTCARKCNKTAAPVPVAPANIHVVYPAEASTQTPVETEQQQQQQQMMPPMAFYPMPVNAPFPPQAYGMPYRYPVYANGPMVAPMNMQPYIPAFNVQGPVPPQDATAPLYPDRKSVV